MKKLILSAAALLAATTFASAADLPRNKKPAVAPLPAIAQMSFTGFYVGLNGGFGQSKFKSGAGGKVVGNGGLVGGTVGYNMQLPNNVVVGLEGDLAWAQMKKTKSFVSAAGVNTATDVVKGETNMFGTLRGRAGYAVNGWLMPYVTGGLAVTQGKLSDRFTLTSPAGAVLAATSDSKSKTRMGWTVGGGAEALLTQNVSVKAEYLYADFGKTAYFAGAPKVKNDVQLGRIGLNYKF